MQQIFSALARTFEQLILQSWWVILFALICYMLFERGLQSQNIEYSRLENLRSELEKQKKSAMALQQRLLLEINSQSDPAWVELVLMKGLGLLKEGQTKVYFDKSINPAHHP
jgi:hypothetical protein